mmetsp:Transcript_3454/g.8707  ORF Transcript_3454/g.8707 Transcript_3454/m.8707 type:complete len:108 (-) Transcript_3454:184-507(-)
MLVQLLQRLRYVCSISCHSVMLAQLQEPEDAQAATRVARTTNFHVCVHKCSLVRCPLAWCAHSVNVTVSNSQRAEIAAQSKSPPHVARAQLSLNMKSDRTSTGTYDE